MKIIFDIETDGLNPSVVHVIGAINLDTGEKQVYKGLGLSTGLKLIRDADVVIGHNIIDYDLWAIKKLYNIEPKGLVVDTCILSRLIKPDILGGHSLEAWGKRLREEKMPFRQRCIDEGFVLEDDPKGAEFEKYNHIMDEYVLQDCVVTKKLLAALMKGNPYGKTLPEVMDSYSVKLEHKAQYYLSEQGRRGWPFNLTKAKRLVHRMEKCIQVIDNTIRIPPFVHDYGLVTKPFKKDGKPTALAIRRAGHDSIAGPFTAISIEDVDRNSDHQMKAALQAMGWKPTEWTPKGSPRLTEDSLYKWGGRAGTMLAKRLMYRHRVGLVKGLIKNCEQRGDGRVDCGGIAQGAITGRVTHRVTANIPRVTSPMGKAIRSLYRASEGKVMVGADASGLELRCLAHYLQDDAVTKEILDGDIHQKNADAIGIDRNTVKEVTYSYLYGAGDEKIGAILAGSTVGEWAGTKTDGALARQRLLKSLNAGPLIEKMEAAAQTGKIKAVDGRVIPIRSEHATLNLALQSCGALIMKLAYVKLCSELQKFPDLEVYSFYHDEFQGAAPPDKADLLGELMKRSMAWSAGQLKIRVPISSESKVGKTWKDTH